jgi:HSP20 family molecular chaperone IbpA
MMTNVNVQKIKETDGSRPLTEETNQKLDNVRQRAFELSEQRGNTPGNEIADWLQAEKEIFRVPDIELEEDASEFQLQLALPGFEAKDIHVAATPDALIVEGEATHHRHHNGSTVHVCEFGGRRLFRRIPLPQRVDVEHVSANLDKGILQVRAMKAERGGKAARQAVA